MNMKVHYLSQSNEWSTPQDLFDALDAEFHFTIDVAATPDNAKCKRFYTKEQDGLSQDWTGERVWCNPPYGREIGKFIKKLASGEADIAVALIPARTDTKYFHDYIYHKAEIRFIKGRLKFINKSFPSYREDGNFKISSAPFPSMIAIWRKGESA